MEGNQSMLQWFLKDPKYIFVKIQARFDETQVIPWMANYWWMSFVFSGLYLMLIVLGRKIMEDRKPFDLRTALVMWNTGLAAFSAISCIHIYPKFYDVLLQGGYEHTICDMTFYVGSKNMGLFAFLFPLSKLPELFDTAFIVLRKGKLSFLHWYHHFSVFIYCWYSYGFPISTGVWFGTVNLTVHAVMYTYYAVRASGYNPPRWCARAITSLQLSQMFVGLFLNFSALRARYEGRPCRIDWFDVGISIFFYASYAILFCNFYYWTYLHKRVSSSKKPTSIAPESNGKLCINGHVKTS